MFQGELLDYNKGVNDRRIDELGLAEVDDDARRLIKERANRVLDLGRR
jgi:hypothetical protein